MDRNKASAAAFIRRLHQGLQTKQPKTKQSSFAKYPMRRFGVAEKWAMAPKDSPKNRRIIIDMEFYRIHVIQKYCQRVQ